MKLSSTSGIGRRFGWGFADQALSSLTNFALTFVVARSVEPKQLGAFGLVFAAYLFVLGLSRGLSTTPLVIRYSAVSDEDWRQGVKSATGSSLAVGLLSGGIIAAVALLFLQGSTQSAYLALAVSLPGLLLQDAWRLSFFAQAKGARAFANDLLWALCLLPAVVIMDTYGGVTVGWFVFAWGAAATLAACMGIVQARILPLPHRIVSWWPLHRDLTGWFLGSFALTQGSQQTSTYLLVALTSLEALGALGAVGVLFGPVRVALMGAGLVGVPEAVRSLKKGTRSLRRLAFLLSGGLMAVTGLWAIAVLLIPPKLGEALLKENWDIAHPLIGLMALFVAGTAAAHGARAGLSALEAAKQTMISRAWISLFVIGLPATGAVIEGGVRGILYGAILAEAAAALILYIYYLRAEAKRERELLPSQPQVS